MQPVLLTIISIAVGLVACFAGYQLFRFLLPLLAGLYGYAMAIDWFGPDRWLPALVFGIGLFILFALFAYIFWSLTVGIGGVLLGYAIGLQVASQLGLGGWLAFLVGVMLAVVFGLLFFNARDILVMLSTALSGAGLILGSLAALLPSLLGWLGNQNSLLTLILTIVLAAAGFAAQYRAASGRNVYAAMRL